MVFPLALEFLSLKSLLHKDLRLAKHPTFKEAVPKTEVLEQPPLTKNEKITALGMANPYGNGMFVLIDWQKRQLGVPLEQIVPIDSDEETMEAVENWHYWVERGYQF